VRAVVVIGKKVSSNVLRGSTQSQSHDILPASLLGFESMSGCNRWICSSRCRA